MSRHFYFFFITIKEQGKKAFFTPLRNDEPCVGDGGERIEVLEMQSKNYEKNKVLWIGHRKTLGHPPKKQKKACTSNTHEVYYTVYNESMMHLLQE